MLPRQHGKIKRNLLTPSDSELQDEGCQSGQTDKSMVGRVWPQFGRGQNAAKMAKTRPKRGRTASHHGVNNNSHQSVKAYFSDIFYQCNATYGYYYSIDLRIKQAKNL